LQLDFSRATELTFVIVVFSILFVDVFDNAGTLIGVTHRTGLMRDGKLARMKQALISDSFAAIFGSLAKLLAGRFSQLSAAVIVLAALFAVKFAVSG
jgi:xanthine/uracil/vitamin C permease (AzgA family)